MLVFFFFFFFQAEDGIRDWSVTGVQTCALPISQRSPGGPVARAERRRSAGTGVRGVAELAAGGAGATAATGPDATGATGRGPGDAGAVPADLCDARAARSRSVRQLHPQQDRKSTR